MIRLILFALCSVTLTFSLPSKNGIGYVVKLDGTYPVAKRNDTWFKYANYELLENRIINGVDAPHTPWVSRMIVGIEHKPEGTYIASNCGGSLVGSHWVLSARHCFFNEHNELVSGSFWASVGDVNYFNGQIIGGVEIHMYNGNNNDDDIALLKLGQDVNGIGPIPVQYDNNIDYGGRWATIFGWGLTSPGGSGTIILQTTNVVLWGRGDCDANSVCLNPEITNSNACSGDSGGPMVLDENGERRLIGVTRAVLVTNGVPCTGNKAFYTSTSYYGDWIRHVIG